MIVPFDSPEELASQIRRLHEDRSLLDDLSGRARARHAELFSEARFEEALAASWCAALAPEPVR
jgi:glycosyltransferase involved in cell wall biosynthesis